METIGTIKRTLEILEEYQLSASKNFGQNFLVDEHIILRIVNSVDIKENSCVIEVGPGIGALTQKLALKAKHVIACDIDERMEHVLKDQFKDQNVEIWIQDFLKVDLEALVKELKQEYEHIYIVSNLPYYITTALIEKMITIKENVDALVLMMQKEVAFKLVKSTSLKDKSSLTLMMDYKGKKEYIMDVSNQVFIPKPHVDSAVIKLTFYKDKEEHLPFYRFLCQCFKQRRKTLANNLKGIVSKEQFEAVGLEGSLRAEQVSLEKFLELYNHIH